MAFPFRDAFDETAGVVLITTDSSTEQSLIANSMYIISAIAVVVTLLSLVSGMFVSRKITTPLKNSVDIAYRISRGDLSKDVEVPGKGGETNDLLIALRTMTEELRQIVGRVRESAVGIRTGSGEVADGSQNLSERTERQASSLEETASAMEEMAATVRQNAENSQKASAISSTARTQAEKGGVIVRDTVAAMDRINESAGRIADIITTIDGIAFQTNLLALNAAVEAARAGEQGRGFAVVASEVRSLAQRSAEAAKEIKELIGDSVAKVQDGSDYVNQSGESLSEIIEQITSVADIVDEISAASSEHAGGIDQVSQAITQMDDMTQQNATLVEQSAAASRSMEMQSEALIELMEFFNIGANVRYVRDNKKPDRNVAANNGASKNRATDNGWKAFDSTS
ncbi:MAG: HAMP domain-containing protein [Proteobacteria bacterium]|nr:HAMP domain-containing protein [Pseudomonadota bacterium]